VSPAAPTAAPRRLLLAGDAAPGTLPPLSELTSRTPSAELPRGGESPARRRLSRWLADGLHRYEREADVLAAGATSQLSPYLHFGCLSAREVVARAREREGAESFLRQLCWRDFFLQLLAANTGTTHENLRPRDAEWNEDRDALARWREGQTGYPIVDAAMRQLAREGWMPNRARLIAGSFLTRTLGLDWRLGARVFYELLVDGDVANNVGNWQWVAGTGANARPNRALNPIRQAARFDPHGDYVRRYVPELEQLPGARVHEPWQARGRLAPGYPERLDARAA
jgi:deoxyribodipyrimidine photo-lyase